MNGIELFFAITCQNRVVSRIWRVTIYKFYYKNFNLQKFYNFDTIKLEFQYFYKHLEFNLKNIKKFCEETRNACLTLHNIFIEYYNYISSYKFIDIDINRLIRL
jgi:hypothetical protein